MLHPRQLLRLMVIYLTLVRHGLDDIVRATHLLPALRFVLYLTPSYWYWARTRAQVPRGERLRLALEELGPIFVKFGQILSTRRDLLPDDLAIELAKLQDQVTPIAAGQARLILEKAYGKSLDRVFASFEAEPLAAASIAQVHVARLHNGREVVVKVVRPGIEKRIRADIEVLYLFAKLAQRYWSEGRRLHPVEVVAEFERNLYDELDLLREAGNGATLRRNFEESGQLYVPEVVWEYTNAKVLVMERISGVPVSHLAVLRANRVNLKYLAEIGVEIFFTQVFRDNFFHADMHPGNIFVDVSNPDYPSYIAVDFGIMGTLTRDDQHYLAENFLAFFHRDYRRVAQLHLDSGWIPPNTRVEEFEGAIRSVCEPIFNRPLKDISFGLLLLRLFQTARRFNMEVQPQLVLLQKTLLNIEGLGRQLYPELDLWQTAQPFLERWMRERVGLKAFVENLKTQAPLWLESLPQLPGLAYEILTQLRADQLRGQRTAAELAALQITLKTNSQRQITALIGSSLMISAALVVAFNSLYVVDLTPVGVLLGGVGLVMMISTWFE